MKESNIYMKIESPFIEEFPPGYDKLTMVEVRAEWSGGTHLMDLIIKKIEREFQEQIRVERIDFETSKKLLSQFGVESAPAILFISKGQIIEVIKETLSQKNLEIVIRNLISNTSKVIERQSD